MAKKILVEEVYKDISKEHRQAIIRQCLIRLMTGKQDQPEHLCFSKEAQPYGK